MARGLPDCLSFDDVGIFAVDIVSDLDVSFRDGAVLDLVVGDHVNEVLCVREAHDFLCLPCFVGASDVEIRVESFLSTNTGDGK